MYKYNFTRDWNLSDLKHVNMWMVSFPYPELQDSCPLKFKVRIQFTEEAPMIWKDAIGLWRKVPNYLSGAHTGHLVLFLETVIDLSNVYGQFEFVECTPVSEHFADHELCSFKYNLS